MDNLDLFSDVHTPSTPDVVTTTQGTTHPQCRHPKTEERHAQCDAEHSAFRHPVPEVRCGPHGSTVVTA